MGKKNVYRHDDEDYADGQRIRARGDSFNSLTDLQKQMETLVLQGKEGGASLRSTSLYAWRDKETAILARQSRRAKFLYELEVDDYNILFVGDLSLHAKAGDPLLKGIPPDTYIQKYWCGEISQQRPMIELLVSEAMAIRNLTIPNRTKAPISKYQYDPLDTDVMHQQRRRDLWPWQHRLVGEETMNFESFLWRKLNGDRLFLSEGTDDKESVEQTTLKDREQTLFGFLRPERIAATLSLATSLGFAASLIYHWGFFKTTDLSVLLLLTPGDYTALALPLIVSVFFVFLFGAAFIWIWISIQFAVMQFFSDRFNNTKKILPRRENRGQNDRDKNGHSGSIFSATAQFARDVVVSTFLLGLFSIYAIEFLSGHVWSSGTLIDLVFALFFLFALIFFAFESVRQGRGLNVQVVVTTLAFFIIIPLTAIAGARESYGLYRNFYLFEDEGDCLINETPLILKQACLVRPLERGALLFDLGADKKALTEDDLVIFKEYDGSLTVLFDAPNRYPVHWIEAPIFRTLHNVPIFSNVVHRAIRQHDTKLEKKSGS